MAQPAVFGVIPARFGSTRFPGKPLELINGVELIAWVIRGTKKSKLLSQVLVATDDARIAKVAEREGVMAVMTDSELPSGSDRIWAAISSPKIAAAESAVVINIQGDEPLVTGELIDSLVAPMLADQALEMATLAHPISLEELKSENSVKVIISEKSEAIYFSRYAIPYSRVAATDKNISGVYKHIGMYAYRAGFLKKYCGAPQVEIEKAEALEQLRALYLGARIKVILTPTKSWGVDTPEDLKIIEKMMRGEK